MKVPVYDLLPHTDDFESQERIASSTNWCTKILSTLSTVSLPLVSTLQELLSSRVMGREEEAVKEVGERERKGFSRPPLQIMHNGAAGEKLGIGWWKFWYEITRPLVKWESFSFHNFLASTTSYHESDWKLWGIPEMLASHREGRSGRTDAKGMEERTRNHPLKFPLLLKPGAPSWNTETLFDEIPTWILSCKEASSLSVSHIL